MKTVIFVIIVIVLKMINAWIKRDTEKMLDDFARKEHERYESDA